jgi:uracil-DNA glycosylase family 4
LKTDGLPCENRTWEATLARWNELNERIVACEKCPRLRAHCADVATHKKRAYLDWEYWGRPVANFGDPKARLLIVGLAPAAHGANRTGRMFTGDRSGEWLYRALHKAGFANQSRADRADDGLKLIDCAITATCHCAPPGNRPEPEEIANCQEWFRKTIDILPARVFLALGQIGWRAIVDEFRRRKWWTGKLPRFTHGAVEEAQDGRILIGSYHPSQQNTFTGKLTEPMLDHVFDLARKQFAEKK